MAARECFPHMPDEVFDMWIQPHIDISGWPFRGDETVASDPAWAKYLCNLSPHFWGGVTWNRVSQAFVTVPLEERAKHIARHLAKLGRKFVETGIAEPTSVKDSPQRVAALASVTNASGQFPKPLVCLVQRDRWLMMDGHHRLGAAFMLGMQEEIPFDCWLGKHDL